MVVIEVSATMYSLSSWPRSRDRPERHYNADIDAFVNIVGHVKA